MRPRRPDTYGNQTLARGFARISHREWRSAGHVRADDGSGLRYRGARPLFEAHSEMLRDGGDQARVAGEAEEVVDTVRLTPSHQFLAGEARICPCKDLHAPPASPNLADEPGHLIFGVGGLLAEHVERQIAVAVVVAVVEA
jgi:hypothetical protein